MYRGCDDFTLKETLVPRLASFWENGEAGTTLRQRPLQERVMTAAHDRRRFGRNNPVGSRHPSKQPAVEVGARKQPLAGDLRAGDLTFGNQLVKLALLYAEIVGCFGGRQQL